MFERVFEADFDNVYELLVASFPKGEYRSYDAQKRLIKNEKYRIYALKNDGVIDAIICVWVFSSFVYIENFAVHEKYRGTGIGSSMLNDIKARTNLEIVLEVEFPDSKIKERRIEFYSKNGFILTDHKYVLPKISDSDEKILVNIMTSSQSMPYERFLEIRDELMKSVYCKENN